MRRWLPPHGSTKTRFGRKLVSQNLLDRLDSVQGKLEREIKRRKIDYSKRNVTIGGKNVEGPHLSVELMFAEEQFGGLTSENPVANTNWSGNLVKPPGNRQYLVRVKITQHHGQPRIHGFKTQWYLPPGWKWTDGLPAILFDMASSEPMIVTRRAQSPVATRSGLFRVVILNIYR